MYELLVGGSAVATIAAGAIAVERFLRDPKRGPRALAWLGIAIVAFIGGAAIVLTDWPSEAAVAASKNEQLTTAAWGAFNAGDYKKAIEIADEVLDNFVLQAEKDHRELVSSGAPMPPTGKPRSVDERQRILERGLLNDVATCYFIKGQAFEKLKDVEKAKKAYEGAAPLTYARTWDPGGWFWSPSQAARDRLTLLNRD